MGNQEAESRKQKCLAASFLLSAFCFLLFAAANADASELSVDKRQLTTDDRVVITLALSGAFAGIERPQIPLQNLVMEGEASESRNFSWVNGVASSSKTLTYTAHPRGAGAALVGPVTLRTPDGRVETLAPIALQVLADTASQTNDPLQILRELMATERDPIFLVAEADKREVWAGEEVVVTWTLYNASNVQQYGMSDIPKLADFWTEELDVREERPEQVMVGGVAMQRLVVRRAALFPLRSGSLVVEPMAINAAVMKRVRGNDPFGMFEGTLVDVHRRASPLAIVAHPVPPGPPVAAVGDVSMSCSAPAQRNGGPVTIDVMMSGRANLRAVPAPGFNTTVDGSVQIINGSVAAERKREYAGMVRRWRFLLFPAHAGAFVVPPLTTTVLTTAGERRTLQCEERTLMVEAVDAAAMPPPSSQTSSPSSRARDALRRSLPAIGLAALLLVLLAVAAPRVERVWKTRREVRGLLRETPQETRAAVDEWLAAHGSEPAALLRETSDRGEAYRAFRSLVDAAGRLDAEPRELRARVRAVVETRPV